MELYSSPPILFISLKRFKSGKGSYFKDKLEDKVIFPVDTLDISDLILSNRNEDGTRKKDIVYELYAISNHYGNMGFGHYTAYCKNALDNDWYDFDDSHVSQVSNSEKVITEAGYNLFYRRKDFNWDGTLDYESIRQTCDFEDFKIEVAHYAVDDKKEESTESMSKKKSTGAPSAPVDYQDEVMDEVELNDEVIANIQAAFPPEPSSSHQPDYYENVDDSDSGKDD